MNRTRARIERWGLLLLLAVMGTIWIFYSREQTPVARNFLPEAPIVGLSAPAFTAVTLAGDTVALDDFVTVSGQAGVPVVLNFWASWCGPCRLETPHFQALSLRYAGRVAILGVNQGESLATIEEFATSFGLTYPLIYDADNQVNVAYQVLNLPTTIFIDRTGLVREVYVGAMSQGVLEDRIVGLLGE